jgi:hypothetical protein
VIVYADRKKTRPTREVLQEMRRLRGIDLLIVFGQLESGVVDALSPDEDVTNPAVRALRYAAVSIARSWMGKGKPVLGPVHALELPPVISYNAPEGYAYYALYPEMYVEAARRFLREMSPSRSVVIGIRSIGTSLSAVVAAVVDAAMSVTLRPRGHPFDRYVKLSAGLASRLRWQRDAHFLVVDEGPGISGSSFAAVARALNALGVDDNRIVFFPSWETDGSGLRSGEAREEWTRHRRFTATFDETILPKLGSVRDLSAGHWRTLVFPNEESWPAVQPQHERRKYLREDNTLLKFAGLGPFGRAKLSRALLLSDLGYTPEVVGFDNGFLKTNWQPGSPATEATPELVERIGDYLEFLGWCARVEGRIPYDELVEMIEFNSGVEREWDRALIDDAPLVAIDGRMLPQEWIATSRGWLKTDALDHHDDHFFPGCQDIAWDYAATVAEFGVLPQFLTQDEMLLRRVPFYKAAYCAFRLGYCRMAEQALGDTPDGVRFRRESGRYESLLREFLA